MNSWVMQGGGDVISAVLKMLVRARCGGLAIPPVVARIF